MFKPSWVKRYCGGDEEKAAKRLAEQHGFSGRETYMRTLCGFYEEYPDRESFDAAVVDLNQAGFRAMVEWLSDFETDVSDELKEWTDPTKMFTGECYAQAYNYAFHHRNNEYKIVHGIVTDDVGLQRPIGHAWVEISDEILFDGVVQRFYRRNGYYERRNAEPRCALAGLEVIVEMMRRGHFGPWYD